MNIIEIIEKKRDNKILSKEEIEYFIQGYTKGNITDYQAAALIMAIYINDLTEQEMTDMTLAMANSGDMIDFSYLNKKIVDKHSTGGVGDKVSLILLPLVNSVEIPVAKMSGRGLGFTGGTIDKLESIPGYKTNMQMDEFKNNVKKFGISLISQTLNIAPADKKIYALRDSIACVENISLIASSIMSKKIANGADKIVLDVTVGKGAFMNNIEDARELSRKMIKIGELAKRETVCILTNMDEPLGYAIGNSLEVIEAIKFLKGNMPEDLKQVVLELGAYMMKLAGISDDIEKNKEVLLENIMNGKAFQKFKKLVDIQYGDISYLDDTSKFTKAKYIKRILAEEKGWIYDIDAKAVGKIVNMLGAGRLKKEDSINYAVGCVLGKKVGEFVEIGEVLVEIHADNKLELEEAGKRIREVIKITKNQSELKDMRYIYEVIQ